MSKPKAPRRSAPRKSVQTIGQFGLELAIDKARAAAILLRADADYLQIPVRLNNREDEKGVRGWIESFAFDALDAALEEAEAERRKILGRELDFAAGPGRKVVA